MKSPPDISHRPRYWIACGVAALLLIAVLSSGCGDATEPNAEPAAAEQVQDADAAASAERAELRRERRELRKERAALRRQRAQVRRERAHARRVKAARKERRELAAAAAAAASPEPEPEVAPAANCHPSYDPCLDPNASDYDCAGGSGDGPEYTGFVTVTGSDDYGLDSDGDGTGCES
jgi:hypothetical protein